MHRFVFFRKLPKSFSGAIARDSCLAKTIDVALASRQHDLYTSVIVNELFRNNVQYEILETDESLPDCCFVEDTCVSLCKNVVALTNPKQDSRKEEVACVARLLKNRLPSLKIFTFSATEESDGGDVLVVGAKHLFVGDSQRTNDDGYHKWQSICKTIGLTCTRVVVGDSAIHLKSLVVHLGDDIGFVVANTKDGHDAIQQILNVVGQSVVHFIDEPLASANMLRVSGNLVLYRKDTDVRSLQQAHATIDFQPIDMSELNKADGAMTCCSVFIQ